MPLADLKGPLFLKLSLTNLVALSGSRNKNPPNCAILDSWVFDNFILADEFFGKALRSLETCLSVNNNLCEKLVWSLESIINFNEKFKVTSVTLFIPDFNLLSCELDNFTFKLLYWYYIKAKKIYSPPTVKNPK